MNKNAELGRDVNNAVMQITSYDMENGIVVADGGATPQYTGRKYIRIQVIEGNAWIMRDQVGTPADQTGLYLPESAEITMTVFTDDYISVFGASINVVELSK